MGIPLGRCRERDEGDASKGWIDDISDGMEKYQLRDDRSRWNMTTRDGPLLYGGVVLCNSIHRIYLPGRCV